MDTDINSRCLTVFRCVDDNARVFQLLSGVVPAASCDMDMWSKSVPIIIERTLTITFCYHLSNRVHSLLSTADLEPDFYKKSCNRTKRLEVIFDLATRGYPKSLHNNDYRYHSSVTAVQAKADSSPVYTLGKLRNTVTLIRMAREMTRQQARDRARSVEGRTWPAQYFAHSYALQLLLEDLEQVFRNLTSFDQSLHSLNMSLTEKC